MSLIRQINIEDDIGYLWPFMPSTDNNPLFYKLMIDGFFFIFTNFVEYNIDNYLKLPGANLFTYNSDNKYSYITTDTILTEQSKWFWDKVFSATSNISTENWEYYYSELLYEETITEGSTTTTYKYIDFNACKVTKYQDENFIAAIGGII